MKHSVAIVTGASQGIGRATEAGIARFGKPEEIADLLAYMVSPAAKWMTGASVRMDGGETKGI
jgi:NAD(P)-dependent dehydrogenase (short-subunit alcohol dehydrogenase family)